MRKKLIPVLLLLAASTTSFAQYWVSGSVGFDMASQSGSNKIGGTTTDTKLGSSSNFSFAPKVGYVMNEKMLVGGMMLFGYGSTSTYSGTGTGAGSGAGTGATQTETKTGTSKWAIAPFVRYSAVEAGKFSVLAEASLGITGGSSTQTSGTTTSDGPSTFGFGLYLRPILEYKLTDKWAIETELNILRLGVGTSTDTQKVGGTTDEKSVSTTGFTFGANQGQGITAITLGLSYRL